MYFPAILKSFDVEFMEPMRISDMMDKGIPVPLDYINELPKKTPLWLMGYVARLVTNPVVHTYTWMHPNDTIDPQLADGGIHYIIDYFGGPEYKDCDTFIDADRIYPVRAETLCLTENEYQIIKNRLPRKRIFKRGSTLETVQFAINPVMYYKEQLTGTKREPNFGDVMMNNLWDKIEPDFREKCMKWMYGIQNRKKEEQPNKKTMMSYIKSIFNKVFKHKERKK